VLRVFNNPAHFIFILLFSVFFEHTCDHGVSLQLVFLFNKLFKLFILSLVLFIILRGESGEKLILVLFFTLDVL
jgi:hypothetical protein